MRVYLKMSADKRVIVVRQEIYGLIYRKMYIHINRYAHRYTYIWEYIFITPKNKLYLSSVSVSAKVEVLLEVLEVQ